MCHPEKFATQLLSSQDWAAESYPTKRIFHKIKIKRRIKKRKKVRKKKINITNHEKETTFLLVPHFEYYISFTFLPSLFHWLTASNHPTWLPLFPKASYLTPPPPSSLQREREKEQQQRQRQQQTCSWDMMAMDTHFLFPYQPSWDWDPHTFGAGDLHEQLVPLSGSHYPCLLWFLQTPAWFWAQQHWCLLWWSSIAMEMESPVSSQASTGYLQDAVAEWSDRCKRRRLAASSPVHDSTTNEGLQNLLQVIKTRIIYGA